MVQENDGVVGGEGSASLAVDDTVVFGLGEEDRAWCALCGVHGDPCSGDVGSGGGGGDDDEVGDAACLEHQIACRGGCVNEDEIMGVGGGGQCLHGGDVDRLHREGQGFVVFGCQG